MTSYAVAEEPLTALAEYGRVPMAFEVRSVLDDAMRERSVAPYVKDYPGPGAWPTFDLSKWGVIAARIDGRIVGGAVIAFDTPDVDMLEGRRDLAALWDLRVAPEHRGSGIGSALFRAVEAWALARGCRELKIETQNTNVPACRFYAKQGCELRAKNPISDKETQLLWYKRLL